MVLLSSEEHEEKYALSVQHYELHQTFLVIRKGHEDIDSQ